MEEKVIRTINDIPLEDIKARQSIQELDNKKANKSDIVSGLNFKGTTTYSALPTSDNNIGDFYYVTDGDGTNGEGNYAWNGTAWYFSGKTTDFGDISTKANAAVNNANFEEGKLKVTKNDGASTETEVIDSSLTKSGKAADAKITGDKIGQLKEDLGALKYFTTTPTSPYDNCNTLPNNCKIWYFYGKHPKNSPAPLNEFLSIITINGYINPDNSGQTQIAISNSGLWTRFNTGAWSNWNKINSTSNICVYSDIIKSTFDNKKIRSFMEIVSQQVRECQTIAIILQFCAKK